MSHIQHKCKTACFNSIQSYLPYLTKRCPIGKTEILYMLLINISNEIQ